MSKVTKLSDYTKKEKHKNPRLMLFHSNAYENGEGSVTSATITMACDEKDVAAILTVVRENGGIGAKLPDGRYIYIPYPCALVEVIDPIEATKDVPDAEAPPPEVTPPESA